MRDPYLYDDADVLINKAGIRDAELLKAAEGDITKYSMAIVYTKSYKRFNTATLCDIHRTIFGDLYSWAGEFRSIPIAKAEPVLGGDTVRYAWPNDIKKELDTCSQEISRLKKADDRTQLVFKLVRIMANIWQTHPFREGNTRAVVSFSVLLAKHLGIDLDYALLAKNAAYVRNALVWASQGMYSRFEYLERIFYDAADLPAPDAESNSGNDSGGRYATIEGYNVSDYKETPHVYDEKKPN